MQTLTIDQIEAEVRARSKALVAAEMTGQFKAAVSFFTPDAVVHAANVPEIHGHGALLELYETVMSTVADFEGTTTKISVAASGDMAYKYGINRFWIESPNGRVELLGKYLAAWKKIEGEWYVAALAFSNDAPPPA
jgi:ketosteroid isomerase-like protein